MANLFALPDGTELVGDYRIQRVLGAGGFGVTYLAEEIALGRLVTIKEYFPADFAARRADMEAGPRSDCNEDYKWGLDRFLDEAQTLARFDHPNIVRVYRYFRLNNTGYIVLQFEEGQSLKGWLKSLGRAPRQKELDAIVAPLLDALELIHKADFLHRDIAPDNIIIRKTGEPVLIDFGAARGEIAAHSKTVSALVKPGYSPYEQYAETTRQQGPWSDIYALGATLYHAITGKRPPDAPSRMVKDDLIPARDAALSSYRATFLRAVDRALTLNVEARPQSVAAWRGDLLAPEPAKPGWLTRALDKKREGEDGPPHAPSAHGAMPPPPDAPGPHGGMLDFVEGLKQRGSQAVTPEPALPAEAAPDAIADVAEKPVTAPPPAPAFLRGKEKKAKSGGKSDPPAKAASTPKPERHDLVPVAPAPRKTPRPKPIRSRERGSWKPMLLKLAIGVGVASAAVFVQDRLPEGTKPRPHAPASQSAAVAPVSAPVLLSELKGHRGAVAALAYSDDGRLLVTAGADATLKVWNANSATLLRTIDLDAGPATAIAVSGNRALTGHGDGRIVLWDAARGDKLASFRRNEASVWSLTFTGSSDRFAATGHDWKVALWDVKTTSAPAHVFEGHESAAQAVAFDPKGTLLASGGADKTVRLWNLETLDPVRTYKGHKDYVTSLAFSPDGRIIAAASLDGSIRLLSSASSRHMRTLSGHKGRVGGLAFSPSGEHLASAGEDGTVRVWDFKRGRTARTFPGSQGAVRSVAYSPDGSRIASAGDDGIVRLWNAQIPKRD